MRSIKNKSPEHDTHCRYCKRKISTAGRDDRAAPSCEDCLYADEGESNASS